MIPESYCAKRLLQLGITDENNKILEPIYADTLSTEPTGHQPFKIFEADAEDNIKINYFSLKSSRYKWRKEGNKWPMDYYRIRLKEPKGDFKYSQAKDSGQFPFFNPGIIHKYREKEEIETLIFVEGEFKSYKGYLAGFDIVGLPSIHGFYNGDIKGKLHEDLQDLIVTCKVKNIIYLTDADTLTVNYEAGKDLSKRPNNFYTAVKYFRESLENLINEDSIALSAVYFSHILTKYCGEEAKGLDDLLVAYPGKEKDIKEDLYEFKFSKKYFHTHNISDGKLNQVYKYLGLGNEKEFFDTYRAYIGSRQFGYKGRRYEYDGSEVKYVRHEDADKYMRVGPDWVKVIERPTAGGDMEEEIVPWKIGEIQRDYKKFPDFLDQIMKYDSFCNEPNFNGQYKRVHNNCYNLCAPLQHIKKHGAFPTIAKFLKHIFQGEGCLKHEYNPDGTLKEIWESAAIGDQFTVALDWLKILIQKPKQKLPVPILVSPENNTGKSTFLTLLQAMFGSNAVIMGNDQFKMKFNAHYITKFIIAIDEGFLEVDKKQEKERLKQLATAEDAFLENKGMNVKKVPYFGKLIICSNDADRVMKIDDGESRWFVVRVPVIPADQKDPDMLKNMKEEIPAFLHFLESREIIHPRADRLWFKAEWFITEQFRIIVETTKNRLDRVIEGWIREQFLLYRVEKLRYPTKYLAERLNEVAKYKVDESDLRDYFKRKNMKPEATCRVNIPYGWNIDTVSGTPELLCSNLIARPFVFDFEEWLTPEEVEEFKKAPVNYTADKIVQYEVQVKSAAAGDGENLPF